MLLEASGSGVGSGGWELTRARTAASLDVPSGKQQTCSTRVAVTVAPGGRSSPGSVQAAGSLQVREMKFSWSGVPMLSTVATAVSGPRLVTVMAKLAKSPTRAFDVRLPIHRMVTARSALAAACACAVASGTAVTGIRATTATPARPSLRPRPRTWFMADPLSCRPSCPTACLRAARPAPSARGPGADARAMREPLRRAHFLYSHQLT
jgi:hypothetical protein